GDIVMGTDDGIIVIPQEKESEILEIAEAVSVAEDGIINEVKSGTRLDEARVKHGYHQLQRK
ncbi:MAG: RraA family protein, partial [Rhodospirillales bacterium]|nr:RraA family protein [Rhodospirillales bacterium]